MPLSLVDSLREALDGLGPMADGVRSRLVSRRALASRSALVPAVLAVLEAAHLVPAVDWTVSETRWSDTGVAIVPIGPPGEPVRLIVKFADSEPAFDALRAQESRLARLHADPRLADWATIVPRVLHEGVIDAFPYFVETALTGVPATQLMGEARLRQRLLPIAAEVIAGLHERTATPAHIDDVVLDDWLEVPIVAIATALGGRHGEGRETRAALEDMGRELRAGLAGREASIGWIHGDYWPGNILAAADGSRISGIVDWDLASDGQLALHDPVHLILLTRRLVSGRELGDIVRGLLAGDPLEPAERSALAAAGFQPSAWERDAREAVLLAWLRHVGFFAPIPGHGSNSRWVRRNVMAVLDSLPRRRPIGGTR